MRVRALRSGSDVSRAETATASGARGRALKGWFTRARVLELGAVALLFGTALGVRVWLGGKIRAPWIYADEITYAALAESFARSGLVSGLEESWRALGAFVYPLVVSPAWLSDSVVTSYAIAKGINVGLMTLAAFVAYLMARRLVAWPWALVAGVLTLALPFFVYSTALMTENAFFPVFVLGMLALMLALEKPTLIRQALVVFAVVVAFATRVQGFALAGIVLTSVLLCAMYAGAGEQSGSRVRAVADQVARFKLWFVLAPAAAVVYVVAKLAQGDSLGSAFGAYSVTTNLGDYSLRESLRWIVFTFAELSVAVGLIPIAALIVLLFLAIRQREMLTSRQRIFVFVTGSAVAWLVVQVGIFSSRFAFDQVPQERSVAYVVPLLLIATVVWIERGLPRPAIPTALALAIPAITVIILPLERMLPSTGNHAFGLFTLWIIQIRLPTGSDNIRALLTFGLVAAAVLVALPLRRSRFLIPFGLFAFLVVSSFLVFAETRRTADRHRQSAGVGANPAWVDANVPDGERAALVYTSTGVGLGQLVSFLQVDLWNRSVRRVDALQSDGFFNATLAFDPTTGAITSLVDPSAPSPSYAVVGNDINLAGELVETVAPLSLYRLAPPFRVASTMIGRFADLWTGPGAIYTRFATPNDEPVTLDVRLSREGWTGEDAPGTVLVRVGPLVVGGDGAPALGEITGEATWEAHSGRATVVSLETPPPPFRVEITSPTFSPAQFGLGDTRQLGVQLTITDAQP